MQLVKVGKILELFYSTKNGRISAGKLSLDEKGVVEDKYYDKDIQRSVLIASEQSYILAASNGINTSFGVLGENILIDYNPYDLAPGVNIKIGELVLEISQNCTICNSLAKVDERLPQLLKNDRGIFARVVKSGTIHNGDNIYLLNR